jgi:hypothetical protein
MLRLWTRLSSSGYSEVVDFVNTELNIRYLLNICRIII